MDQHRQVLIFRTDSNEFRPSGLFKMRKLGFFAKPERFPPAIDSSRSSLLSKSTRPINFIRISHFFLDVLRFYSSFIRSIVYRVSRWLEPSRVIDTFCGNLYRIAALWTVSERAFEPTRKKTLPGSKAEKNRV